MARKKVLAIPEFERIIVIVSGYEVAKMPYVVLGGHNALAQGKLIASGFNYVWWGGHGEF